MLLSKEQRSASIYVLKKLSDTRWACRANSITATYHTLEAVIATLRDIRENETKANIAAEAKGLLQNISDFTFILALEVCTSLANVLWLDCVIIRIII